MITQIKEWFENLPITASEKKKFIVFGKGKNENKALIKTKNVYNIKENLYIERVTETKKYRTGTETEIYYKAYIYYPEINIGLPLIDWWGGHNTMQGLIERYDNSLKTIAELRTRTEEIIANDGFINNIYIAFAELAYPDLVDKCLESRKNYLKAYEERRKQEQQEKLERIEEANRRTMSIADEACKKIISGGTISNEEISFYVSPCEEKSYKLFNYLFRTFQINVPLRTQGWINSALESVTVLNGKFTSYEYDDEHKPSQKFAEYMQQLIDRINYANDKYVKIYLESEEL